MMEKQKVELLEEAIRRFNTTSTELEKSYRLLEEHVRQLKKELEVKNQALKESTIEKESLREQAERNNKLAAVGEMSARMAHELRNPLGSIELFASLLKNGLSHDPAKQEWAEHIKTAVGAMDYALGNLLFFTGKPKPDFKETDFKKVIEESSLFATHLLAQKEIQLVQSLDSITESVSCDEDLLKQAFLNLIFNAIEALPKGGTLTLEAKQESNIVIVKVCDTGCGISKENLSRIFDPFYTTKNKGTGLGLAIVNNAILSHRGTIEIESPLSDGNGTCFTIRLPKDPEAVVEIK